MIVIAALIDELTYFGFDKGHASLVLASYGACHVYAWKGELRKGFDRK